MQAAIGTLSSLLKGRIRPLSAMPLVYAALILGLGVATVSSALGGSGVLIGIGALAAGVALRSIFTSPPTVPQEDAAIAILPVEVRKQPSIAPVAPLWQQLLNAIPDASLILNGSQKVVALNALAKSAYPGALGRNLAQLDRSPDLLAAVDLAGSSDSVQVFDLNPVAPVERHLSGIAAPLTVSGDDATESTPAMLIMLRDRTEVERVSQMRADFVANASHELRTPLASLKGFIETLQGAAKDDPKARDQFLAIMHQQADRMSRLIDDLLSLSRIEMREHVVPTTIIDLSVVADSAVSALQPLAAAYAITLTKSGSLTAADVKGDRDELMQVVQNLVQNAIKYGRRGGKVEVSLAASDRRVTLSVMDNGVGIAPEHLPRLTERFYRVSAKDSRERGGTGLGLAIVKHIVNRHRGELRIASTQGVGSTFSVELPVAE